MIQRTLLALVACTCIPLVASAATLSGELVNGTTGAAGTADLVELIDVAQGMSALKSIENVEGSFELTDVPESNAHLLLRVTRGDVSFSQNVEDITAAQRIEVYDSTTDRGAVEYARHHVIFRRDAEHMVVTELFEFDNRTDPPMTVATSALPMRFGFTNPTHGDPEISVGSGDFPITMTAIATETNGVLAVERPLRPGTTRMIVRYLIEYAPAGTEWVNTMVYPAEDRRVLVNPSDVQVMVDQMIPTDSPLEGYASYSGLPVAANTAWNVRLAGGSAVVADHDHAASPGQVTRIEVRPHRFAGQRIMMMVVVAALLAFGLLLGISRKAPTAAETAAIDKKRLALSALADRYVTGELSREQFEKERDRLLASTSKSALNGHASSKKASTAAHSH